MFKALAETYALTAAGAVSASSENVPQESFLGGWSRIIKEIPLDLKAPGQDTENEQEHHAVATAEKAIRDILLEPVGNGINIEKIDIDTQSMTVRIIPA